MRSFFLTRFFCLDRDRKIEIGDLRSSIYSLRRYIKNKKTYTRAPVTTAAVVVVVVAEYRLPGIRARIGELAVSDPVPCIVGQVVPTTTTAPEAMLLIVGFRHIPCGMIQQVYAFDVKVRNKYIQAGYSYKRDRAVSRLLTK